MRYLFFIFFISISFGLSAQAPMSSFLGSDSLVCDSTSIKLTAPAGYSYLWSTDDTTQSIKGFESKKYWVRITDPLGNIYTDTIDVTIKNERSNRANHWYMGKGAAIKFDSTDSKASADNTPQSFDFPGGSTSVSHGDGSLLFYSNGSTLYNKNHKVLASGIKGDSTAAQNSILFPEPESYRYFYLFTLKNDSLFYTQIDRDGSTDGNGKVTAKNIFLYKSVDARLTAVKSGEDIWVISHVKNSAQFVSFKITKDGPPFTPVFSTAGSVTDNAPGFLKINPDATKLVLTGNNTEIFDFDGETGKVSNPVKVAIPGVYGAELSQDGGAVYLTTRDNSPIPGGSTKPGGSLYKIDPATGIPTDTLFKNDTISRTLGGLQLGPDGKLYLAKGDSCLGVVDGDSLNFYGLCLTSGKTNYALPNFPADFMKPPSGPSFSASNVCNGTAVSITGSNPWEDKPYIHLSFIYDFGDGSPKVITKDASHTYAGPGKYTITGTITANSCKPEQFTMEITVFPIPDLSHINSSYILCTGKPLTLDAKNSGAAYLWSTGSMGQKETFTKGGNYSVLVGYDASCTKSKAFTLTEKISPVVNLGKDISTCQGTAVSLNAGVDNVTYAWNTGANSKTINPVNSGPYSVTVSDGTCTGADTLQVEFLPRPAAVAFSTAIQSCNDLEVLDAQNPGFRYKWNTGDTTQKMSVTKPGDYSVDVYLGGCKVTFNTFVKFNRPVFSIKGDSVFCEKENEKITLDAGTGKVFNWSTGAATQTITVAQSGNYSVKKTDLNNCTITRSINVTSDCRPVIAIPNAFTPNHDGENDVFIPITSRITNYELSIFNRWGELIFYTTDTNLGWDGTYKSEPLTPGTFVYKMKFDGEGDNNKTVSQTRQGYINLFR